MRRIMHVLAWGLIGLVLAAGLTVGGYRIGRDEPTVEAAGVAPQSTRGPSNHRSVRPFTGLTTPAPSPADDPSPDVTDSPSDAPARSGGSPSTAFPASSVVSSGEGDSTCRDDDDRSDSDNSGPGSGDDDRSDSDSSAPGSGNDDSNSGSGSDSSGSGSSGSGSSGSGSGGSGSSDCD